MILKINGIIVSAGYGAINAIHKTPHKGIDLVLNEGTPLSAIQDGVIVVANEGGKLGKYIMLRLEDGKEVIYGHLSQFNCKPGDIVHQGQTIAFSGNTGASTGPHLHLQVIDHGHTIDPTPYAKLLHIPSQPTPSTFDSIREIGSFFTDLKQNGLFHALTGHTFGEWLYTTARLVIDSSVEIGMIAAIIIVILGMCGATRARKWLYWTVIITILLQMIGAII